MAGSLKVLLALIIVRRIVFVSSDSAWTWLKLDEKDLDKVERQRPSDRLWGTQCGQTLFDMDVMEGYNGNGILSWEPTSNRYLFMLCGQEKISLRIKCILNHMLYAGLLNRTLVVAMHPREVQQGYNYSLLFDVDHFRRCYGPKTLLTTEEYESIFGHKLSVDQIFCWTQRDSACPLRPQIHIESAQNAPLPRDALSPALQRVKSIEVNPTARLHFADLSQRALLEEFSGSFSAASGEALVLGEMLNTGISHQPRLYTSGELPFFRRKGCGTGIAVQPQRAIFQAAMRYVRKTLGGRYVAVHMRRGDLVSAYCHHWGDCNFPVPQLAECVRNKVLETNISTVFLATDGNETEVKLFKDQVLDTGGRKVKLFQLSVNKIDIGGWASPLVRDSLIQSERSKNETIDPLILSTLDKVICAYSSLFMGSVRSAFTADVQRLRYGLGTANCEDRYICDLEPPWDKNDFRLQPFQE